MDKYILIKDTVSYREIVLIKEIYLNCDLEVCDKKEGKYKIFFKENKIFLESISKDLKVNLTKEKKFDIHNKTIVIVEDEKNYFDISSLGYVRIGISGEENITLKKEQVKGFKELKIEGNLLQIDSEYSIFINGFLNEKNEIELSIGDIILIDDIKIVFYSDYIGVIGNKEYYVANLEEKILDNYYFENFPIYKRSPRIIKRGKRETVELMMPPSESKIKKGSLVKIIVPPLVMMALTILITIINPRGIYVIVTIIGTLMSTVFSVTSYINEKKENIKRNRKREIIYSKYLLDKRKQLNYLMETEREALSYNNPNIYEIENLIKTYNSRIYERSLNDFDFINIDMGSADKLPSYTIDFNEKELNLDDDKLINDAKEVRDQFLFLKDMPVPIDLKTSHLGIVGEKKDIHEQLKLIFSELTFSQSYHDIEIIFLYEEKYRKDFEYLKWYPHFKVKATNVTGIIDTERVRDQVLGTLNKILKDRKIKDQEKNKEERFSPHFIFVVDDPRLIINHSIMEYLQVEDNKNLGFSVIYTTNSKSNLPEYIKTVVTLDDKNIGTLLIKDGIMVNQKLKLNHVENVNLESLARKLSCLEHVQGIENSIPESITFFKMYNVNHPEELKIKNRWEENQSHKTLAVPLGVRGEGDIVNLNLHEKAHGPHGLVAGTTGSGKSEIVQSYILSLAVNFHPYEVGFLLIDYKGGGMASLFKNLPHLLGTITNLDGAESMRAMASIKSELARRQFLFNEYGVNHINSYNKLFKDGKAKEPLPHLFLISDEFAELKKEQPDFMSELVSAARIGRSLGIHLILATQKPSGVVDDQIWSNSKFKLALKVQNESDSNEILKTPDAASITLPGRAFLQVGNNEIYELFQSAWSGASYTKEEKEDEVDNRIYLINELGQSHLLNNDLSVLDNDNKLNETELDVVVNHIENIFEDMNMESVRKPWLPSLEENITSPFIKEENIIDISEFKELDMTTEIGLVDIPERQAQEIYKINFEEEGNLAIFSSPGFGKSTTLTTIALTMAIKNSANLLNYYILDLGNSSLIQLKELPHTADYLTFDDTDKLNKLIKILDAEVKRRKKLLGEKSALNFSMYNKMSDDKLEAKVIFIDNYDVIKEFGYEVEEFINRISRDGVGLGIFLVISASRSNSIKYATLNNFKNKIAHYMFEESEITTIVGRSKYGIKEIKGRALVKQDNVNSMQVYRVINESCDMEYTLKVLNIVNKIKALNTGVKAKGIPTLPKELNRNSIKGFVKTFVDNEVVIGIETEKITPVSINLEDNSTIIVGGAQSGKTSVLKIILEEILERNSKSIIFDSSDMELYNYKDNSLVRYIEDKDSALKLLQEIKDETVLIKLGYEEEKLKNPKITPKDYYKNIKNTYIIMDDIDKFLETIKATMSFEAEKILSEAITVGFKFIGTTNSSKMKGYDNITKMLKDNATGILLCAPNEQTVFSIMPSSRVKKPEVGFGFLFKKGELTQIMIPEY